MPIWFELIVLMVAAYCGGIFTGWLVWSKAASLAGEIRNDSQGDEL